MTFKATDSDAFQEGMAVSSAHLTRLRKNIEAIEQGRGPAGSVAYDYQDPPLLHSIPTGDFATSAPGTLIYLYSKSSPSETELTVKIRCNNPTALGLLIGAWIAPVEQALGGGRRGEVVTDSLASGSPDTITLTLNTAAIPFGTMCVVGVVGYSEFDEDVEVGYVDAPGGDTTAIVGWLPAPGGVELDVDTQWDTTPIAADYTPYMLEFLTDPGGSFDPADAVYDPNRLGGALPNPLLLLNVRPYLTGNFLVETYPPVHPLTDYFLTSFDTVGRRAMSYAQVYGVELAPTGYNSVITSNQYAPGVSPSATRGRVGLEARLHSQFINKGRIYAVGGHKDNTASVDFTSVSCNPAMSIQPISREAGADVDLWSCAVGGNVQSFFKAGQAFEQLRCGYEATFLVMFLCARENLADTKLSCDFKLRCESFDGDDVETLDVQRLHMQGLTTQAGSFDGSQPLRSAVYAAFQRATNGELVRNCVSGTLSPEWLQRFPIYMITLGAQDILPFSGSQLHRKLKLVGRLPTGVPGEDDPPVYENYLEGYLGRANRLVVLSAFVRTVILDDEDLIGEG